MRNAGRHEIRSVSSGPNTSLRTNMSEGFVSHYGGGNTKEDPRMRASSLALHDELDEMFGGRETLGPQQVKQSNGAKSAGSSSSADSSLRPSSSGSAPTTFGRKPSSAPRRIGSGGDRLRSTRGSSSLYGREWQDTMMEDFASVLRKAGQGKAGVSGENFLKLLSSYVQKHASDLRSGALHLSLNTPCLSHLSACISQQRNEEMIASQRGSAEAVALPNASRMDQHRRDTLKLSIMLRDLAHLRIFAPQKSARSPIEVTAATGVNQVGSVENSDRNQGRSSKARWVTEFPCDLSFFPVLRVLEARGIAPAQLVGLPKARSVLEVFSLEDSHLSCPAHILLTDYTNYWYELQKRHKEGTQFGESDEERRKYYHKLESPASVCDNNFTNWSRLTTLRLTRCGMEVLDASVGQLNSVVVMQLNENRLHDVSIGLAVLPRLSRLQHLDLSFNRISSIVGFSHAALDAGTFCRIQTLILRHNRIISTEGLEVLLSLRQLDLGHNMLGALDPEILRLRCLRHLTALQLEGNPIVLLNQYRSRILVTMQRIHDPNKPENALVLDGRVSTASEIAHALEIEKNDDKNVFLRASASRNSHYRSGSSSTRSELKTNNASSITLPPSEDRLGGGSSRSGQGIIRSSVVGGEYGGAGGAMGYRGHPSVGVVGKEYPEHVMGPTLQNKGDRKTNNHRKSKSTSTLDQRKPGGYVSTKSSEKLGGGKSGGRKKRHARRAKSRIVQFENEEDQANGYRHLSGETSGGTSSLSPSRKAGKKDNSDLLSDSRMTMSNTSDDEVPNYETSATTTDEWEKIRLYKERLAAKMAAIQSRLEKKRTQHGPTWLDRSWDGESVLNRKRERHAPGVDKAKHGVKSSNITSSARSSSENEGNHSARSSYSDKRTVLSGGSDQLASSQDADVDVDGRPAAQTKSIETWNHQEHHSSSLKLSDAKAEKDKKTGLEFAPLSEENLPMARGLQENTDQLSTVSGQSKGAYDRDAGGVKDDIGYTSNHNQSSMQPSRVNDSRQNEDEQQDTWSPNYQSGVDQGMDINGYDVDEQLESIEYIAEVHSSMNDSGVTPIILRVRGGELSEIEMRSGYTMKRRDMTELISVRTAQGQLGDTVLRAEFEMITSDDNVDSVPSSIRKSLATVSQEEASSSTTSHMKHDREHVLYVLRQSGTLEQLLSVMNARIELNRARSGKRVEVKLQCLSCLLVFLWDSKEGRPFSCPKCSLPNVRVSKKALSKSIRHQIRTSKKEAGIASESVMQKDADLKYTSSPDNTHGKEGRYEQSEHGSRTSPLSDISEDSVLQSGKMLSAMPMAVDWDYMDVMENDARQNRTDSSGNHNDFASSSSEGTFASKFSAAMRATISNTFRRKEEDAINSDQDEINSNASMDREMAAASEHDHHQEGNHPSDLLVSEHYEQYFREVTFKADDNNTERFHGLFPTKIVPHGVRSGGAVKDGTGSTEIDALVVTTDESIYFFERLPPGNMLKFRDCPKFSAIAQFSLSDVCQIAIGFAGQRLRIDFVSESWSLITRDKQSTYHFVQEAMPMVKVSRLGSLRRGTLKMPSNELLRLDALAEESKTRAPRAVVSLSTPPSSPHQGKYGTGDFRKQKDGQATPVKYANEDQETLELIEEYVIGQGQAGRSPGGLSSMRVKLFIMLFERPNPSSLRLVRHVPKNRLAPRTLILTESALYLCDEDYASEWPEGSPPFRVLRSALFTDIVELVVKEHQLDFTIVVSTIFGIVRRNKRWRFRAQNRRVKDIVVTEIRRQIEQ